MPPRSASSVPVRLRAKAPKDAHEWVTFEDPEEDRIWRFDVTWLTSSYECIFGRGCQGVLTAPTPELVQGCCSYGAHFTDDADVANVKERAATLADEHWQFRKIGLARGVTKTTRDGEVATRLVEDACIFLNRPGFAGGAGCALHVAALDRGERPLDYKPQVCWQLPMRREDEDDGNDFVTTTITQWERKHWGSGGDDFHWWCTEAPEAFLDKQKVYQSMKDELIELTSQWAYDQFVAYLNSRGKTVPHPVERRKLGE